MLPQSRQLSSFPDMKKKRLQMSTQDALSLNTDVPSFVMRKQRRDILSKHIFIKSSSHLREGVQTESQKLNIFSCKL